MTTEVVVWLWFIHGCCVWVAWCLVELLTIVAACNVKSYSVVKNDMNKHSRCFHNHRFLTPL